VRGRERKKATERQSKLESSLSCREVLNLVFSGEAELLFPPLSHLEVVGNPTMEKFDGKPVVVFTIRVNINQKARTIEEVLSQRKQTAVTFTENVTKELTFDVKLISNSDSASARAVLKELLMSFKKKSPEWFNSDVNLQEALRKVLEAKQEAVSAFVKAEPSLPEKVSNIVALFSKKTSLAPFLGLQPPSVYPHYQ
jgi:hypothetical protein